MSKLERITLVVEPADVASKDAPSTRNFYEYDAFVGELRKHTTARISILESPVNSAPAEGYLLLHAAPGFSVRMAKGDVARRQTLASRSILLNCDSARNIALLTEYRFAGAIDPHRYSKWLDPHFRLWGGFYGLTEAAKRIAGSSRPNAADEHGDYCLLRSKQPRDLPVEVIAYLKAYAELAVLRFSSDR